MQSSYGVPMPVQPTKSIAAVAISNPSFGIPEVMAAGIYMHCWNSVPVGSHWPDEARVQADPQL